MELSSEEKKRIISKDGRELGTLAGSTIDTTKWTVLSIMVDVPKEQAKVLGIKKKLLKPVIINVSTDLIAVVGDVIQLRLDMKELAEKF
jgi:sporulation protein YlmC with PRC-barrel domain